MKHLQLQSSPISPGSFGTAPHFRVNRPPLDADTEGDGLRAARGIVNALALSACAWLVIIAATFLF